MTKMVQLSEEAYSRLRMAKRPLESFSDAVLRLTGAPGKPLQGLVGLMSAKEAEEARQAIKRIDELDRPRS